MNPGLALLAGVIFGFGLVLSGMTNPAKVLGFLDVTGRWDPTLAVVMGSALLVTLPAFRLILKRGTPLLAERFELPVKRVVDARLIGGSVLFGIGWGLAGFCPGPAITALASIAMSALGFVAAMIAGMVIHDRFLRPRSG